MRPLLVGTGNIYVRRAASRRAKSRPGVLGAVTDVFVPVDWVDSHRDEIRIVDVRDAWEFDGIGHLPGAVNVPFEEFRSDEGEAGTLPPRETWEELLSQAGVGRDTELVAYDDTHGVFAARFLVTAFLLGHDVERLHLLDGDFSSWRRDRETTGEATDVEPTDYDAGEPAESPLVDYETVLETLDAAESGDAVLVDTREDWEFDEGHLPGAVQFDWREVVDDESRGLRDEDEVRALLEERGIHPEKRILLYCNTARRISHTYLVLRHLGYEDVAFYEGSLTEWEARDGPMERADEDEGSDESHG